MKKQKNSLNFRAIAFVVLLIVSILGSYNSIVQNKDAGLKLGLDLKGGLYLLLGIDTNESVKRYIQSISSDLQFYAKEQSLDVSNIYIDKDSTFKFKLTNAKQFDKIKNHFNSSYVGIILTKNSDSGYIVSLSEAQKNTIKKSSLRQTIQIIRDRLDQFGLAEPTVVAQGSDEVVVELPGVTGAKDEARAKNLISKSAYLQFLAVDEVAMVSNNNLIPKGDITLSDNKGYNYILKSVPILDGSKLIDASVGFSQNSNQPVINFSLNSSGAEIFAKFTAENVGKRLAIVLDDSVYSAPSINERIGGGSGQISGNYTISEANDLVIALKSGSLTSKITVLEQRSIGPSLGADSIKTSFIALAVGFIIVILFMIFYYGLSGVFSVIALVGNLFMIIAVMSLFKATLTLPGIAGLILTIGMAVDANVIIIERIREFIRDGYSGDKSILSGYNNAFTAIVDSNITTLIAAFILFGYGSGPIKGFAITISIGIFISMFTSIFATKGFYNLFISKISKKRYYLWFGIKG